MSRHKSPARLIAEPLLIAAGLACAVRAVVSLYAVPSASMVPALQVGDHIAVTPYRSHDPLRGDVIVFRAPRQQEQVLVKRVIATPGEVIDTSAGRVRIGGHAIAEPYLLKQASSGTIEAQVVPPGTYFVMGDNREDSLDSRSWGPVSRALVLGKVRLVVWSSRDPGGPTAAAAAPGLRSGTAPSFKLGRIFKCVE